MSSRMLIAVCGALLACTLGGPTRIVGQAIEPPTAQTTDLFFDDSRVHEIRLAVNSKDWLSLKTHYLENTYYPCDFRWGSQVVRNIGIRSRGNGSRSAMKPGLRVDFDRYTSDQTFLGLKSVVLRNHTQDASNMHERLSMLLFKRLGLPAPRTTYATLYVNNEYIGLYSIVESIDKGFLQRTYGENEGYLFEYDHPGNDAPYYLTYKGSDPNLYVPAPFKPETHEADPRPEFVEQMIRAINGDDRFRPAVGEFLDLPQVMRHVAIENFLADPDGVIGSWGMNNFYLYRFQDSKRFTIITWDRSEAFKGGSEYGILHHVDDVPSWQQNRLMSRAIAEQDLYDVYLDTLLDSARTVEDGRTAEAHGWLELEILRAYEQIRDAVIADPTKPFSNDEFVASVEHLLAFASTRPDFVRREVDRLRSR